MSTSALIAADCAAAPVAVPASAAIAAADRVIWPERARKKRRCWIMGFSSSGSGGCRGSVTRAVTPAARHWMRRALPPMYRRQMVKMPGVVMTHATHAFRHTVLSVRDLLATAGPFVVLALLLLIGAYWLLDPTPPRRLVMATGTERGAYAEFGAQYA